jgi:butyryl-CoA dehydrogenase
MKTYASEQGNRATSLAIQVLGGYGYTVDFTAQQYYRDLRIMAIYEGTTGIQSLDLLGRKVGMDNGRAVQLLSQAILQTAAAADEYPVLKNCADALRRALQRTSEVLQHLSSFAKAGDIERYTSDATVFMEMTGYVVIGWQWLKMAVGAQQCLEKGDFSRQHKAFYSAKIHTAQFFFRYEMPHASACAHTLLQEGWLTDVEAGEEWWQ